ncbi:MAG: peptidoglycan editing factor PgeF [Candidatus Poribacteria bacterium]|nr:peptidoglycan editing factor PgeF [Candidatus Poribacteria bacterium]
MRLGIRHRWGIHDANTPFAATSLRQGGVSPAPYDSLNLGHHVGDRLENVIENRRRFATDCGLNVERLVLAEQTHSTNVAVVSESDAGRGVFDPATAIPATDSLITNAYSLAIGVCVADCVPILVFDPINRAVAAIHAGRVGTYDGVIDSTFAAMGSTFGTNASDCAVIVGPSIGSASYEVSVGLAESFRERFGEKVADGRLLDLRVAVDVSLARRGIRLERITHIRECTVSFPHRYFSHRRDGDPTGRMLSVVYL